MAVALDDLIADRGGFETQPEADLFFDDGIDVGIGPYRPRNHPHPHRFPGVPEALPVAFHLRIPQGKLQAKGDRLRMNAVRTPDHNGILPAEGSLLEHFEEPFEVLQQQVRGFDQQQRQGRVEHIRRGQPLVDVAGSRADVFGNIGEKGNDIMLGLLFDLGDAGHVEIGLLPDRTQILRGNAALLGKPFANRQLDLQPFTILVFQGPDPPHFRPGITFDHG